MTPPDVDSHDTSRRLGPDRLHCTCGATLAGDLAHLPAVTAAWRNLHRAWPCLIEGDEA